MGLAFLKVSSESWFFVLGSSERVATWPRILDTILAWLKEVDGILDDECETAGVNCSPDDSKVFARESSVNHSHKLRRYTHLR